MKKFLLIFLTIIFVATSVKTAYGYNSQAVEAYNKGIQNARDEKYSEAISMFKRSIELDQALLDAYYNLSSVYEYLGNYDKAVETLETYLRSKPEDNEVALRTAKLYFSKGNYSKALIFLSSISSNSDKYKDSQVLTKMIQEKLQTQKTVDSGIKNKKIETNVYKDFQGPTGIAEDSKGNIYIAQYTSNSIIKMFPDGKRSTMLKGKPLGGPLGLAIDKSDNIYVANYISDSVLKITQDGEIIPLLTGIKGPYFLYLNDLGILYVSVQGENSLIKVDINSN